MKKSSLYLAHEIFRFPGRVPEGHVSFILNQTKRLWKEREQEKEKGTRHTLVYSTCIDHTSFIQCMSSVNLRPPVIGFRSNRGRTAHRNTNDVAGVHCKFVLTITGCEIRFKCA